MLGKYKYKVTQLYHQSVFTKHIISRAQSNPEVLSIFYTFIQYYQSIRNTILEVFSSRVIIHYFRSSHVLSWYMVITKAQF